MALNENIVIKLMADTSNYTTKMQAASAQAEHMSTSLEKPLTTSQKVESGLTKVGAAVGAVSLAIGVAAVKAFMDFDASMSAVQSNTSASAAEMDKLRAAALEAGARTVYSATESADAINELAKAGMSTTDILNGGLNGALDLAAAGQMGVADAAELTASALNEFGLTGDKASHVADLLAAGANTAQGSVSDMGEALNMVGTNASQLGMSIEDTTGALTMLASKGITGSEAGTQLRSALIGLTSASGPAKKEMDSLGISMYDNQGQFVGLANFAGQLQTAMSKLTPEQRANSMGILFSNAAMTTGNVLYQEGADGVKKFTQQVNQSGFAQEQAAALTNNLKGDIEQFTGSIETSLIKIGSGANGPLRNFVQGLTNIVTAFGDLDPKIQQSVVLIGMGIGAFAGLHKVFGNLSSSSSTLKQNMGLMLDPVQRIKTAVPDLISGAQQLGSSFTKAGSGVESLSGSASRGGQALSGLKTMGSGVLSLLGGPWGAAFTAGAIVVAAFAQQQAEAKSRVDKLTEALEGGTSAATYFNKALSDSSSSAYTSDWVSQLSSGYKDLWSAVDKAGISHKTFIKAIEGDETAITSVQGSADRYSSSLDVMGQMFDNTSNTIYGGLSEQQSAYKKSSEAAKDSAESTEDDTTSKISSTMALIDNTGATGENTDATSTNTDATTEAASADDLLKEMTGGVTDAIDAQSSALKAVVDSLKDYYGFAESADEATASLEKSYDDATDAIGKNGKTVDAAGTSLDLTTEKGRNNQSALTGIRDAAYDAASAYAAAGESTDSIKAKTQQARDNFVRAAQQMGLTKDAAQQLADKYGLIPSKVTTTVLANTDNASSKISTLRDELRNVDGMVVRVTAVVTQQGNIHVSGAGGSGTLVKAAGGFISGPGTGTSDSIPARLSKGEYVIRASAVDHYGVGLFDQLNYQRYATGGLVQEFQTGIVPSKTDGVVSRSSQAPTINFTYVDQVAGLGAEARLTQAAGRAKSILADVL